jgi:hypothetical protein
MQPCSGNWSRCGLPIRGEVGFGVGAGVVPAHVGGDRVALLGVSAVIGAVEREVAQGGEFGFDPVQPGSVHREEHQLHVMGGGPAGDLGMLVRGEAVQHQVELLSRPALAQQLEESRELLVVGAVGGGAIAGKYEFQPGATVTLEIACQNLGAWVSPRHLEFSELMFGASGELIDPLGKDALRTAILGLVSPRAVVS